MQCALLQRCRMENGDAVHTSHNRDPRRATIKNNAGIADLGCMIPKLKPPRAKSETHSALIMDQSPAGQKYANELAAGWAPFEERLSK
jgi:hypothetical protein